jgi:hypothetical protein
MGLWDIIWSSFYLSLFVAGVETFARVTAEVKPVHTRIEVELCVVEKKESDRQCFVKGL